MITVTVITFETREETINLSGEDKDGEDPGVPEGGPGGDDVQPGQAQQ